MNPDSSGPTVPTHTTGIAGFDHLIAGPLPGDNIVFRVDDLDDFRLFCRRTAAGGGVTGDRPLVYFRFARHRPLFSDREMARYRIDQRALPLDQGFEHFITTAHAHIISLGATATLLFDSLSDLSGRYYSDRMVGNFFQLTCPLILETGSMAYFSLRRYHHSLHAIDPILETTQIFVDVYRDGTGDERESGREPSGPRSTRYYIKPYKTDGRNRAADFSTFAWERNDRLTLVTGSGRIAALVNRQAWPGLRSSSHRMVGVWARVFLEAEVAGPAGMADTEGAAGAEGTAETAGEAGTAGAAGAATTATTATIENHKERLLQLVIAREGPILELARRYFDLHDLIAIWKRMIGTGFIGGKSVGMLLSRAILRRDDPERARRLETHDSFYVASDVYYTYLVVNNCWWERQRQKDSATFLEGNDQVRDRMLAGRFPDSIMDRFMDMIDYYGTSPIIVRSSSLLEDNFGNAFAGKYESVFCTMRGTREARLQEFLVAVRRIYASTISDEALSYRQHRGILDQDEQMALLVQRVSGAAYRVESDSGPRELFFPHLAGVAFSFNPYAWHPSIDPRAGLLRLVFGLGTRAVDRSDDDYTRVVALNAPDRRPEAGAEDVRRHTQRRIDVLALDREGAGEKSVYFDDITAAVPVDSSGSLPISGVATRERDRSRRSGRPGRSRPRERPTWNLTFDPLLRRSTLAPDMQRVLSVLRDAYGTDVDVEFTINLDPDSRDYRINLVQCRPLQVQGAHLPATPIPELTPEDILIRCSGGVIGHSRVVPIGRILYVRPDGYVSLPESARYELTGVIRTVATAQPVEGALMLLGPGRWGTSTPSLGIPVRMSDIGHAVILCEIDRIHAGLVADMSLGTHFFNEMVERNLLYLALRVDRTDTMLDTTRLERFENRLSAYLGASADRWTDVVTVIHFLPSDGVFLNADSRRQTALVYRDRKGADK